MYWVVQDNIRGETEHKNLIGQLVRQQVPHAVIKVVPFSHELQPEVSPTGLVYVNGSMTLGRIARERGWTPGYFDANLGYGHLEHYGREELVNYDFITSTLREALTFADEQLFIRPVADDKTFAGTVMTRKERLEWLACLEKLEGDPSNPTVTLDDLTVTAQPKQLLREYRFFVVDGKVVTGSIYKLGRRVTYNVDVDFGAVWYASWCADKWNPDAAYALDVALTPDGYKVLETNSINAAGFYACDMGKYVAAIENLGRKREAVAWLTEVLT